MIIRLLKITQLIFIHFYDTLINLFRLTVLKEMFTTKKIH